MEKSKSCSSHHQPAIQRKLWRCPPHLELQILHVRSHQIGGNWLHRLRDTAIFLQEKGELVVVGLELLLLQQDHLGRFRNLHTASAAAIAIGLCHRFPFNDC